MKRLLLILLVLIPLMGCATTQDRAQFYQAQQDFLTKQMAQEQKPTFEIKAVNGKAIENLESVTFYMPSGGQIRDFKQFSEAHPGWEVAKDGIRMITTLGGIGLVVHGVTGLAESVGKYSGGNTTYNQSVSGTGNTATTKGAGTVLNDATSMPTVVYAPDPVIVPPSYAPIQ